MLHFLFLIIPLETSYLRMYWTDLHQMCGICTHIGEHDYTNLLFMIAEGTLLW